MASRGAFHWGIFAHAPGSPLFYGVFVVRDEALEAGLADRFVNHVERQIVDGA
jgi:hypothetical protein